MQSRFTFRSFSKCGDGRLHVSPVTAAVAAQLNGKPVLLPRGHRYFVTAPFVAQQIVAAFDLNAAIAQREAAEKAAAAASVRTLIKSAANGGDLPLAVAAVSQLAAAGGNLTADEFRALIVSQLQSQEPHATAVAEGIMQKAIEAGFVNHASLLQPRALLHVARGEAPKGADLLREAATQTRDACAGGPRLGMLWRQVALTENTGFVFGDGVASLDQLLRSSAAWHTAARQNRAISVRESSALFTECCTAFAARALQLQRMQLRLFREIAAECAGNGGASQLPPGKPAADAASTAAAITALLAVEKARQHDFWALQLLCIETARYLVHAGSPLPAAEALRTETDMLLVLSEQHRAALAAAIEEWADLLLQQPQGQPDSLPAATAHGKPARTSGHAGKGRQGPASAPAVSPLQGVLPRHILAAILPLARPPTSTFNAWVWAWEQAHERGQAPAGTAAAEVARLVAVMSSPTSSSSSGASPSSSSVTSSLAAATDSIHSVSAGGELESAPGTMAAALDTQLRAWEASTRKLRWARAAALSGPPRWAASSGSAAASASSAASETSASAATAATAELAAAADTAAALAASAAFASAPDHVTFNHYLTLISASGYAEEAARVPALMASAGVPPTASTYETLLRAALRGSTSSSASSSSSMSGGDGSSAAAEGNSGAAAAGSDNHAGGVRRAARAAPARTPAERAAAHRALEDSLDRMIAEAQGRGIRVSSAMLTMRLRASAEGGFMGRAAQTLRLAEEHRIPLLSGALSSLVIGFVNSGRVDAAVHLFAHTPGVLPAFAPVGPRAGSGSAPSEHGRRDRGDSDDYYADAGGGIVHLSYDDADTGRIAVSASSGSAAAEPAAAAALIQPINGVPIADASSFRSISSALLSCGYLHDTVDLLEAFGVAAQGEMVIADSSRMRGFDSDARAAAAARGPAGRPAWLLAPGDAAALAQSSSGSSGGDAGGGGSVRVARLVDVRCLPRLDEAAYSVIMRSCLGVAAAHVGLVPPGLVAAAQGDEVLPPLRRGPQQWFQMVMRPELQARVLDASRLCVTPSRSKQRDSLAARLCPDESVWQDTGLQAPAAAGARSHTSSDAKDALTRLVNLCNQRPPHGRHFHGQFAAIEWRELERRLWSGRRRTSWDRIPAAGLSLR